MAVQTTSAQLVWNRLNGIVCLYKPAFQASETVRKSLLTKLSRELNEMQCRPQRSHVNIVGDTSEELKVIIRPSYADHPLAIGPRYMAQEMKSRFTKALGSITSGVCVIGVNRGTRTAFYLDKCNLVSTYRLTGQLGILTDTKMSTGNILFRCRSNYIRRHHVDKVVASIEASQQKSIFTLTGIHPQSQAAYDMLSQGLCRPVHQKYPLIYSIKCIELNLPYFTIEIVLTNESTQFLLDLACQIGSGLRNSAITTSIQCIRSGFFSLEDALLKKHWTLQNVIDNMARCDKILKNNREFSEYLKQVEKEEIAQANAHENDLLEEYEEEKKEMTEKM